MDRTPNVEIYKSDFKNFEKRLKQVKWAAKKTYYCNEFHYSKNDICRTWKSIRNLINKNRKNSSFPGKLKMNNITYDNKKCIADKFNSFFVNIGASNSDINNQNNNNFENYLSNECQSRFNFRRVTSIVISKIIKTLEPKTSKGPDFLTAKFIKSIGDYLAYPISLLIKVN